MKKQIRFWIYSLFAIAAFLIFTNSCKEDDDNNNPNQSGTVTDIEGNVYNTVTIGKQIWMAENLKTTRFRDGTSIPLVTDNNDWGNLSTPGYCWYDNDINNKNKYGALYNFNTINTGKIAPIGWHVPTLEEYNTLSDYLGGESLAGDKMKSTSGWNSPNTVPNNNSSFSGFPGGARFGSQMFSGRGAIGCWWTSTQYQPTSAYLMILEYNKSESKIGALVKVNGFSVRCIKDK